jgi:hypothetical protein
VAQQLLKLLQSNSACLSAATPLSNLQREHWLVFYSERHEATQARICGALHMSKLSFQSGVYSAKLRILPCFYNYLLMRIHVPTPIRRCYLEIGRELGKVGRSAFPIYRSVLDFRLQRTNGRSISQVRIEQFAQLNCVNRGSFIWSQLTFNYIGLRIPLA